jgi:hypothetical protein
MDDSGLSSSDTGHWEDELDACPDSDCEVTRLMLTESQLHRRLTVTTPCLVVQTFWRLN